MVKKSLGQHFLTSKEAMRDIVTASGLEEDIPVLEIGPGRGVLTRALLDRGARVIAIELDRELILYLTEQFSREISSGQLTLIEGDVLTFDPGRYFEGEYRIVANIPYYITGKILRRFLGSTLQPTRMVLLIQKEVADRIVARDEKESVLSISVKVYGNPRIVRRVPRRYFNPPPNVDSAVIAIDDISKEFFTEVDEKAFFNFMKTCFSSKRKQLVNTLPTDLPKDVVAQKLEEMGFDSRIRAEDIPLTHWKKLFCTFTH